MSLRVKYRVVIQTPDGYETVTKSARGPFYHGGRARVRPGGLIKPGHRTNGWGDFRGRSVYVFFSASRSVAESYQRSTGGYLYEVEPTGEITPDTDPDSFKTEHPLRVIARVGDGP